MAGLSGTDRARFLIICRRARRGLMVDRGARISSLGKLRRNEAALRAALTGEPLVNRCRCVFRAGRLRAPGSLRKRMGGAAPDGVNGLTERLGGLSFFFGKQRQQY